MHPVDVRMSPWLNTNFVVGTNTDADWPMAQFIDVNNGQRITFNLTAAQAATAQTLRIGISLGFAGGRNRITVNAGQAGTWTSSIPAASINLNSRGVTRGTYRGPNQLYTYNIPTSALHAGTNTIDLPVVSGSSGSGFLSPNVVYDAIDLVPTASLTSAPHVQTITLTPSSTSVGTGALVDFTATAHDQFRSPIAANIDFAATDGVIDQRGHFTSPLTLGSATITATSAGVSAMATVMVVATPPNLLGDYNGDNRVDAADYTVWRDTLDTSVAPYSTTDGDGNGRVDPGDYLIWRQHFGESYTPAALALETAPQPTPATTQQAVATIDAAFALYQAPATPAEAIAPRIKALAKSAIANPDPNLLLLHAASTKPVRRTDDHVMARSSESVVPRSPDRAISPTEGLPLDGLRSVHSRSTSISLLDGQSWRAVIATRSHFTKTPPPDTPPPTSH